MQLHTQIQGKGFPILCLHGHPGSSQSMSVFTEYLSRNYLTIAPDLRGYGKSRPTTKFHIEDHLNDLQNLLQRLQIKRCLLLGWSLGGILSLELALRFPQQFSGLILIASAAHPRSNHPSVTWQDLLYTAIAGSINYFKPGWEWNINTFGKRSLFRYLFSQQTNRAYHYLAQGGIPAYFQTSIAAHQALSQAINRGYNRLDVLQQLDLPCLVLAGAEDRHITAIASQETAKQIKKCQWQCYPNTAHLFPWEIPELVLEEIEKWLIKYPETVRELSNR